MTMYELNQFCTFMADYEIFVMTDDLSEMKIEWNEEAKAWTSKDYEYIYDEDENIIDVKASLKVFDDELQNATVMNLIVDRYAIIYVRL